MNRPEERVRLELVEYLTLEAEFSPHRLSFESPVKLRGDKTQSRTDIIGYDDDFQPLLLVECKSGDIVLNEKAAQQVARYHQKVMSAFILLSNGVHEHWYNYKNDGSLRLDALQQIPLVFSPKKKIEYNFKYWQERGFAGGRTAPAARNFIIDSCRELFGKPNHRAIYLDFSQTLPNYSLANYYRIYRFENQSIAFSIIATPHGGTNLTGVLNQRGENKAFLTASIDLIAKDENVNSEIHSAKGLKELDLISEIGFNFKNPVTNYIEPIMELLVQNS